MPNLFAVLSDVLPANTVVVALRGSEALSEPYRFIVGLLVEDDSFDLDAAIHSRAILQIHGAEDEVHPFHGLLSSVELLHDYKGRSLYRAVLVPKLWDLTQSIHSRVFTEVSVPEIIEATLKFNGLPASDFELRLSASYAPREHVCQYKETDLAFITRWMDREGMYYFFEHDGDREKLVITDDRAIHKPSPDKAVRYTPFYWEDAVAVEALGEFTCHRTALPKTVLLDDYDYLKPSLSLGTTAPVAADGHGVISVYGGNFTTPEEGKRLAQVRAEALLAREKIFRGRGRQLHLRSGYTFELDEHPRQALNAKYLVTRLEHYGVLADQDERYLKLLQVHDEDLGAEQYSVRLEAISADVAYRSPEQTPWPRIYGLETATICGEADSDYAQIDDHGRYNVRLKFDESDLVDGSASTWVRMMQPHAGGVEGFHFPLRKATEIVLAFLGGDPDRPVITGAVPNATTPSPVAKGNASCNVIQTGGGNRLELQDKKGAEHVRMSSPHKDSFLHIGSPNAPNNNVLHTKGKTYIYSGEDWSEVAAANKKELVEKDYFCTHKGLEKIFVTGKRTEQISGDVAESYEAAHNLYVKGPQKISVYGGKREDTVKGGVDSSYNADSSLFVKGKYTETVTGDSHNVVKKDSVISADNQHTSIKSKRTIKVTGECHRSYGKDSTLFVGGNYNHSVKGIYAHVDANEKKKSASGKTSTWFVGGKVENVAGHKSEIFVGGKAALTVGLDTGIFVGLKTEVVGAIHNAFTAGIKLETNLAPVFSTCKTIETNDKKLTVWTGGKTAKKLAGTAFTGANIAAAQVVAAGAALMGHGIIAKESHDWSKQKKAKATTLAEQKAEEAKELAKKKIKKAEEAADKVTKKAKPAKAGPQKAAQKPTHVEPSETDLPPKKPPKKR